MLRLAGMGFEFDPAGLPKRAAPMLLLLAALPAKVRERLIFSPGERWQSAIQKLMGGPADVRVRFTRGPLSGIQFTCSTSQKYFMLGGGYEWRLQALAARLIGPEDVVIDVGAHHGFWSLIFSRCAREVIALEPSPLNFSRLEENTSAFANIRRIREAAWDSEGSLAFQEADSYSKAGSGETVVRSTTLDALNIVPRLIKIDVEGEAGHVLRGGSRTLAKSKAAVLCEIHHEREMEEVRRALEPLGYAIKRIGRYSADNVLAARAEDLPALGRALFLAGAIRRRACRRVGRAQAKDPLSVSRAASPDLK